MTTTDTTTAATTTATPPAVDANEPLAAVRSPAEPAQKKRPAKKKPAATSPKGTSAKKQPKIVMSIQPYSAGVSKPEIVTLSRRGGVMHVSRDTIVQTRFVIDAFLDALVEGALLYTDSAHRLTIKVRDVARALDTLHHKAYVYTEAIH